MKTRPLNRVSANLHPHSLLKKFNIMNTICICHESEKHGQTSVMCCNRCGLPDEDFWQPSPSTETGQQGVEEQAEWEFLTIIRANRAILKNADGKVAFPNHSAKSAALEVYDDMIEIISHLPAKRSGKEKQVADYVNNLSQPQVGQDELWEKAAMELFLAHNPDSSPENEVNKRIINGFRKDMKILSLFFTIIKK